LDITIKNEGRSPEISQDLKDIEKWLAADLGREITEHKVPSVKGEKDGFLLTGLAVVGAALSAINTTINVLNYWAAKHKQDKSVLLIKSDGNVLLGKLSDTEISSLSTELVANDSIEVVVSKLP